VWIGSADEGSYEADIEQAIDWVACGAEAEHANASGRGPEVHLALSGATAAIRGDLDVAVVQGVWDMDRVTSRGQAADRDLLRRDAELVEGVRGVRVGGGAVGPGVVGGITVGVATDGFAENIAVTDIGQRELSIGRASAGCAAEDSDPIPRVAR
jgi:hypothetical protein